MENSLKKFIIALCIVFICCFSVLAQEQETETLSENMNELQFKIGMFPYAESLIGALIGIGGSGEFIYLPSLSVQYLYYLDPQVGIGASFSVGAPVISSGEYFSNIIYTSLQFKIRGIYFDKEKIKLYGELGFGGELLFSKIEEEKFFLPFISESIVPFGIWFGSDKLFGTAELAWGSEGSVVTLGCGFRF